MNRFRVLSVVGVLTTIAVVSSSIGFAAAANAFPVCIGLKHEQLGSPSLTFTLSANSAGSFFQLTGQAAYAEANGPGGSSIVYAVSGAAITTVDGYWISLAGAGADQAQTVFNGTFAIQVSSDPTRSKLTYAKRSLDGTSNTLIAGAPEFLPCP
jgi:hypothetical protein